MPIDEIDVHKTETTEESFEDSTNQGIIRIADFNVKSRVLLEAEAIGHSITYRRVKRVNELVIDGNVYDEVEMLFELAHSLKAEIDGHLIEVGYNGKIYSYLKIDGEIVTKKIRLC